MLEAMVDELADETTRDRPHRHRGQQRRREQANSETDPTAPASTLTAKMIARLLYRDATVNGVRDENHPLDRDLLVVHQRDQRIEILRGHFDVLVAGNEHISQGLSHHILLFTRTRP